MCPCLREGKYPLVWELALVPDTYQVDFWYAASFLRGTSVVQRSNSNIEAYFSHFYQKSLGTEWQVGGEGMTRNRSQSHSTTIKSFLCLRILLIKHPQRQGQLVRNLAKQPFYEREEEQSQHSIHSHFTWTNEERKKTQFSCFASEIFLATNLLNVLLGSLFCLIIYFHYQVGWLCLKLHINITFRSVIYYAHGRVCFVHFIIFIENDVCLFEFNLDWRSR